MPNVKSIFSKGKIKVISVREYNKKIIYDYILRHATRKQGVPPHEIENNISPRLTRQTVHNCLRELVMETRIYKKGKYYFPCDWYIKAILDFSFFMQEHGARFIDPYPVIHEYKYYPTMAGAYDELSKRTCGITVSSEYCNTDFAENCDSERYLFEFVNRMGAFIVFIFLESMRPRETKQIKDDSRQEMFQSLISNAINIPDLFDRFCLFLNEIGLSKPIQVSLETNKQSINSIELDKKSFNKVSESFRNLYPGIYEGLESFWEHSLQYYNALESKMARSKECKHNWKEMYIYKYKRTFFCVNCHLMSNRKISGANKKREKEGLTVKSSNEVDLENLDFLSLQASENSEVRNFKL